MKYLLVIAVLLSFTAPAKVQAIEVRGVFDCGQWLDVRTDIQLEVRALAVQLWVLGYLSGKAMGANKEFWKSGDGLSNEQVMYWIDNYCREHPLKHLDQGADILFHERTVQ